jgi:putative oxidoreductase
MNIVQRFTFWGETHHPKWLDILRMVLGAFLIYKAIDFLINIKNVGQLLNRGNMGFGDFSMIAIGQVIVIAHLIGGFFIMIGLHTRLACLIQAPILIGALILLKTSGGYNVNPQEVLITASVLVLLLLFLVMGDGTWSYNKMFKEESKQHPLQ